MARVGRAFRTLESPLDRALRTMWSLSAVPFGPFGPFVPAARAWFSAGGTVLLMNGSWDQLSNTDRAIATSQELAQLEERVRDVALVRTAAVRGMRAEGKSVRQICSLLGLSRWVVCDLLKDRNVNAQRSMPLQTSHTEDSTPVA